MTKNFHITTNAMLKLGVIFMAIAVVLGAVAFGPLIYQESRYQIKEFSGTNDKTSLEMIDPTDKGFSISIPKIDAQAEIIADVDPYNSGNYLKALTQGVAHAKYSAKPDSQGNIFLFAHSSDNFYNANRYNSVFFLLYKLEKDDIIYITYNDQLFTYKVVQKEIVTPEQVEYLTNNSEESRLTLMTCWPPGTTSNRLIVTAK